MPDGKRIIFAGNAPGHLTRTYSLDVSGGTPQPLTPEGVIARVVSPDGSFVAGLDGNMHLVLYPVRGGQPRPIPGPQIGFTPVQWSQDGVALFGYREGQMPTPIYRLDLTTGKQKQVAELGPRTRAGVVSIGPIAMSRDATHCVYSYYQALSVLYVISGLK
jgi:Tol biopolymer transport system component